MGWHTDAAETMDIFYHLDSIQMGVAGPYVPEVIL
jgi:hypothetical protein